MKVEKGSAQLQGCDFPIEPNKMNLIINDENTRQYKAAAMCVENGKIVIIFLYKSHAQDFIAKECPDVRLAQGADDEDVTWYEVSFAPAKDVKVAFDLFLP